MILNKIIFSLSMVLGPSYSAFGGTEPAIDSENDILVIEQQEKQHYNDIYSEIQQESELPETKPYSIFTLSKEAAENRLGLTDGLRVFHAFNVIAFPASTPFKEYKFVSLFTDDDFNEGKIIPPQEVTLSWQSVENKAWQPKEGESFCNTTQKGDLLLTVTAKFSAHVILNKVYTLHPKKFSICYLKPLSLDVVPKGRVNYSSQFNPEKGFSASSAIKFPTTGFDNARFDVLLKEGYFPANLYLESSHQGEGVNVDNKHSKGRVILTKPVFNDLIVLDLKYQDYVLDSYAFQLKKWYVNDLLKSYNWKRDKRNIFPAEEACSAKGDYRVAARAELTNSEERSMGMYGKSSGNYFRRAIGEGLLGEWGKINLYPNAFWRAGYYWAFEEKNHHWHWAVLFNTGEVLPLLMSSQAYTVCISNG